MKKSISILFFLLVIALCFLSCTTEKNLTPENGMSVSSYIRTWPLGSTAEEMKSNNHWSANNVKGQYMTDLIIAFAHARGDGSIYFPDADSNTQPFTNLWSEASKIKSKYPHIKMHVSIGGWGADQFSQIAADPDKRKVFTEAVVNLVTEENLDGIDIDWEYPIGPDWGEEIPHSDEDGVNFISLLTELRFALGTLTNSTGKQYSLSIAAPASNWYTQKLDVVKIASIVDTIKLMTYDYYGSWNKTTGHHANLYNNPTDPEWGGWSTAQTVDAYLAAGVPSEKLVLGVAFYGRAWKGVEDGGNKGLYQPYKEAAYPDGLSWADLKKVSKKGKYTKYWDDVAKAPYLYNGDIFISYTDKTEIAEIGKYVKEKNLGGVMTWEYGHDVNAELLSSLCESLQ